MEKNAGNDQGSAQIQEVLQKLRVTYVTNLPRQLNNLETLVMVLGKGSDYQHSFNVLHRAIHNLRGTAGTYGIPIISTICSAFEDYLMATLKGASSAGSQQISTCLRFIDLLHRASDLLAAGKESFEEIEASLETL